MTEPRRTPNAALPHDAGLVCKMADSFEDFDSAFEMVYRSYLSTGLISPNPHGRRVLSQHLSPTTTTFISYRHGHPLCTATLIGDSTEGLPMEAIFPGEIEGKRISGLTVAEVSCLASTCNSRGSFHRLFMQLMRILGQHARCFGIDQLVVAVHPKHAPYYERTMGFRPFGDVVSYGSLHDAPAVAIALDFHESEANRAPAYDLIFAKPLPVMEVLPRPMPPQFVKHFQPMVNRSEQFVPLFV